MVVYKGLQQRDVTQAAEAAVVQWLRRDDWQIVWDSRDPELAYIEARKDAALLLVRVTSAIEPDQPSLPGNAESARLRQRAAEMETIAWAAKVQLDRDLNLRWINWVPLNS